MSKEGFTLIEWLVSFALIIFIATLLFQFSALLQIKINKSSTISNHLSEIFSAVDLISRKIYAAPIKKEKWKKISKEQIVWHDHPTKKEAGWIFENEKIFFFTGTYQDGRWKIKRKNLVASNIKKVVFKVNIVDDFVRSIHFLLESKIKDKVYLFERDIVMRNRFLS